MSNRSLSCVFCVLLAQVLLHPSAFAVSAGEGLYYSLQSNAAMPAAPTSLSIQAPGFLNVKAGATLFVHLLRGDQVEATSKLVFTQAYENQPNFQAVPFALFLPQGQSLEPGEPLPGVTLTPATANLTAVAGAPSQYQLLWVLTAGSNTSTPQRAILTGPPTGFATLDLKLSAVSAAQQDEGQRLGSVLFFNRYTSNASNAAAQNTTLSVTNTNPATNTFVRLFFVDASTCQTRSLNVCLTARQTLSFLASDVDPGTNGYLVAIATDAAGQPIKFNWLMGQAIVRQIGARGAYAATLSALTIAKHTEGAVPNVGGAAELIFNDEVYDRLPTQLAFDSVPSHVSSLNLTTFLYFRPVADLGANATSAVSVQLSGWGSSGNPATTFAAQSVSCYGQREVRSLPRTMVEAMIPIGTTGWFAASAADQLPLLGAQFNVGAFSSGTNGRPLKFSVEYRIRVPVAAVTCQ